MRTAKCLRPDLNYPPTAVGGILSFVTEPLHGLFAFIGSSASHGGKPLDHEVSGRSLPNVAQAMHFIRGFENYRSGSRLFGDAVLHRFDRAFLDYDQLLVRMLVAGMWRFAGIERRHMTFQLIERRRGLIEELATGSGLGGLSFNCL